MPSDGAKSRLSEEMDPVSFEEFRDSLQPFGGASAIDPALRASIQEAADVLASLEEVTRDTLAVAAASFVQKAAGVFISLRPQVGEDSEVQTQIDLQPRRRPRQDGPERAAPCRWRRIRVQRL
jgi:hypothetical protein